MILLADESVDQQIIDRLRDHGYTVISVVEMEPGITDGAVFELANISNAILITADKDFGEIVFRQRRVGKGVLLLRLAGLSQEKKALLVVRAVQEHQSEIQGSFAVITPGCLRIRKMRTKNPTKTIEP
ncbi:MAG: DUF5615 family PIN-like protein [Bacillota bacterium]